MESNAAVTLHFEDLAVQNYLFFFKICVHLLVKNIKLFKKALLMNVKFFLLNILKIKFNSVRLLLCVIWPYIKPHMDKDQMGGRPGCSVEHFIIKMTHFILSSTNGNIDAAVIGVLVDYSKEYTRMKHSDILCNFIALNVPTCAVKIV
jgi:hypothetical protein